MPQICWQTHSMDALAIPEHIMCMKGITHKEKMLTKIGWFASVIITTLSMKFFTKPFFIFSFFCIILFCVTGGKLDIPRVYGDSIHGQAHIPVCSAGNTDAFVRCHATVFLI